ncbi:MAG TPA: AAA family ATPase [Dehalococcoidia bacterium]|nr:AAA family ATPase [Dehalococcoidia bacterium]
MLKKLRLTNFKAFGDPGLEIEPGLITVLIGPNGTGKSSVLQALLLLKQQGFGDDLLVTNGRLVDFGTYLDLVHNHRNQLSVDLEILVDEPDHNVAYWGMNASERTKVVHRLAEHPRDQIEGDRWRNKRDLTGDSSNRVSMQVQRFLADFVFVPTMRGFSRRRYEPGGEIPTDIPSLNDPEQWARTTATLLAYNKAILQRVSNHIGRVLEDDPSAIRDWLHISWRPHDNRPTIIPESETESPLIHEGFGSNQLVVLLTWLTFAKREALVGIEEPEIHLHPKAQGELARVLAQTATQEHKQIILTTHSEHILAGLLIRVAAGDLGPEQLAIYSFSRDETTGEASAERLHVSDKGAVKGGLRGFFEVERQEVDRYISALSQRQQ